MTGTGLRSDNPRRSVITIACGKRSYFDLAVSLARSIKLTNPLLQLYIVSDLNVSLPSDLNNVVLIRPTTDQIRLGFSIKLMLDFFVQTEETIFIDADCIVLGDLSPIFDSFRNAPFGVFGIKLTDSDWFGDTASICAKLAIAYRPFFNGGVYYLRKSLLLTKIFSRARELEGCYDEFGFVRLRGQPNDEPLLSAAMAQFEIEPISNDGSFYADFQWWPELIELDVLNGRALLRNRPTHPQYQAKYPAESAVPIILHFLGHHVESPSYHKARAALWLRSLGVPFAGPLSSILSVPHFATNRFKELLRPLYRKFFGTRKIKRSKIRLLID